MELGGLCISDEKMSALQSMHPHLYQSLHNKLTFLSICKSILMVIAILLVVSVGYALMWALCLPPTIIYTSTIICYCTVLTILGYSIYIYVCYGNQSSLIISVVALLCFIYLLVNISRVNSPIPSLTQTHSYLNSLDGNTKHRQGMKGVALLLLVSVLAIGYIILMALEMLCLISRWDISISPDRIYY